MLKITLFKGGNMKYCSKCGSKVKDGVKFCGCCGEKLEEIKNSTESGNQKDKSVNLYNSSINNDEINKNIVIIRYCIGCLFILGGLFSLPRLAGFLSIMFGISLMPIFYKILRDKKNFEFRGMQIIFPVILIMFFGLINGISNNTYLNKENDNKSKGNQISKPIDSKNNDNDNDNDNQTLEEKWKKYYKNNNSEVIDVDSDTLHSYGVYYKNKVILTGISIKDKSSNAIKANIGSNDSIFYSFIFNFEDKNEIKKYKAGDVVIVIGEVSASTSSKTVTVDKCHIVLSYSEASARIVELHNNQSKNIEYAKSLEKSQKQAEADKILNEKKNYISKCETKNYQDIMRNPNGYKKQYITVTGKVIQITSGWFNSVTIRLNDSSNNTWYVSYKYASDTETKILDGDNISVYGQSTGTTSYTTIFGSQVTIPSIDAKYININ